MTKLFFMPEGQEPDYDPIPNTRCDDLIGQIFPDRSPKDLAALQHHAIKKILIAEDDAIAHLMLEGMQFLCAEDYADNLLYARLVVLNVHRFKDLELYEPWVNEAVKRAVNKFYESKGEVHHG